MRTEFGVPRSECACNNCQANCQFMPGFLIPADLDRLIPPDVDAFAWAKSNLLASPGALVMKDGKQFRIPTLVPAVKPDGSCINLTEDDRCRIHDVALFGCAFFSSGPEVPGLSRSGIIAVLTATDGSLYKRLWRFLDTIGKRQKKPDVLRERMRKALGIVA